MAGYGSRFTKKGYKIPKPLIKVSGEEMFIKAIKDLPKMKSLKIITRKEIVKDNNCFENINNFYDDVEEKKLNKMTNGQAITCLEGLNDSHFVDSQSLLISACDMGVIFDRGKYEELLNSEDIDVLVWGCRGYPGCNY